MNWECIFDYVGSIYPTSNRPKEAASTLKHRPGSLILGEFTDCSSLPVDLRSLQTHMQKAAKLMGAHAVQSVFHKFNPYGLSGVVVIKESHFAIHTWPEYNYAAVDLFSCGKMRHAIGFKYLAKIFGSKKLRVTKVKRG